MKNSGSPPPGLKFDEDHSYFGILASGATEGEGVGARAIPTRVGKSFDPASLGHRLAGHPHAGGEISFDISSPVIISGPSPRGWGNRWPASSGRSQVRAIPTRVGKSWPAVLPIARRSGHPHAGGEIKSDRSRGRRRRGPSPRGWGNHILAFVAKFPQRAIPTRVGKSTTSRKSSRPAPGHPHAGGEIERLLRWARPVAGPSPRGWGNPLLLALLPRDLRAIPTRVGKS